MTQILDDKNRFNRLCNEVLTVLEIREAGLLNWGFIHGTLSLAELDQNMTGMMQPFLDRSPELAALWTQALAEGITPTHIIANLHDRRLIFMLRKGVYRTRFGETIRSLYLLRQRFSDQDWNTGARLVADMRILLRRRRFPRRDRASDDFLSDLQAIGVSSSVRDAVAHLLQEPSGRKLALAHFQTQSAVRIFRSLRANEDSAIVIGAGTGAGKTKAFYVPALAHVAETLDDDPYVQVIAIYPRIELLKDQLRETYSEARKLDSFLRARGKRPITLGAYYGDAPTSAEDILKNRRKNWQQTSDKTGWVCPYLFCPACGQKSMVWRAIDVKQEVRNNDRGVYGKYARLYCRSCEAVVDQNQLLLTRRQMVERPPDVLFTTTEMLNRRLSNSEEHRLFGIGVKMPPRLLLMDEIHLNEGIYGAQIGYLLRRWRYLRGAHPDQSLTIIGLSATLTGAERFFSRLTGLLPSRVAYISPSEDEMVEEGVEYNLLLKGDPTSGTTLLSTSVRTVMLLARALDPLGQPVDESVSGGAYGQRVFAFSDKLDVINRWYHIEREVENAAEPYSSFLFVKPNTPDERQRYALGQHWRFVSEIHGSSAALLSGLRVDITSSQYGGVDDTANLIIASPTLEVGYNDPTVGAVIQHKAPHTRASFLQRKGRAGRTRSMRPWMVVIASAYGQDRWAFQHPETLFDPLLLPLDLPLENYYVQKIQASYALIDWLALQLNEAGTTADVWSVLSSAEYQRHLSFVPVRVQIVRFLRQLIETPQIRDAFKDFLMHALGLETAQKFMLNQILWGEPRPLIFDVIPTLIRQLETEWRRIIWLENGDWQAESWQDQTADRPLSAFVPPTLFSDLKSPEVLVHIPDGTRMHDDKPMIRDSEVLSVALALSEYAPGKVNKRFARKEHIRESHWLHIPEHVFDAGTAIPLESLQLHLDDTNPTIVTADDTAYQVFRPLEFTLSSVPRSVRPTSNARLVWRSQFSVQKRQVLDKPSSDEAPEESTAFTLGKGLLSRRLFSSIMAYTQGNGTWVEVTRLAVGVQVYTRYERGERREYCTFTKLSQPAAIGFSVDADALRFTCVPLDTTELRLSDGWRDLYKSLSRFYFLHLLRSDPGLRELRLSDFELEWLWQLELSLIVRVAIDEQITLAQASEVVQHDRESLSANMLRILFDSRPLDQDKTELTPDQIIEGREEFQSDDENADFGILQTVLLRYMRNQHVQAALAQYVRVLWDDSTSELDEWLRETYRHSLGMGLLTALLDLMPDIEPDDLYMDVTDSHVWISEAASGGVGLIARLEQFIVENPRQFDRQLLHRIRVCDRALLASQLYQVADRIQTGDAELAALFSEIRTTYDLPRMEDVQRNMTRWFESCGIPSTRQLGVALNVKFLRPNSNSDTDALIAQLSQFWEEHQRRLNTIIDLPVIVAAAARSPHLVEAIQQALAAIGDISPEDDPHIVYNLLTSLLWQTCNDSCPDCIEKPQRYQEGCKASRALLLAVLGQTDDHLHFNPQTQDLLNQVLERLSSRFSATVVSNPEDLNACRAMLLLLLTTSVEVGYQVFYPIIEQIDRDGRQWKITLALSELIGG